MLLCLPCLSCSTYRLSLTPSIPHPLFRPALVQYEGTHNFHNFTIRKPATAPDAKRYMLSFR